MKHLLAAAACAALLASAPAFAQSTPDTASPSAAPSASSPQPSTSTPSSGCQPGQVLQANGQPCPAVGSSPSTAAAPASPSPGSTPPSTAQSTSPTTIIVPPTTPPAATATAPSRPSATTSTSTAAVKFIDRQGDNQHLASNLMGKVVQNAAGERIGTVKDILFDEQGNMTAVIIGFGGFLGIGEKSVGIPFAMVKTNKDANGNLMLVVASLDKDAINSAPDFLTLEDVKARAPSSPSATPSNPSRP